MVYKRKAIDYPLAICKYCFCTDYGYSPVSTGPHNLCEGIGCKEAQENYEETTGEKWDGE
jgi:hypothetical protein